MLITFPEISRGTVESMKSIRIMADYVPDSEYNHLTMKCDVNHSGGNREMSARELDQNHKYGAHKFGK